MRGLYYRGNALVYAETTDGTHLVPDTKWAEYLLLRPEAPRVTRCFSTTREVLGAFWAGDAEMSAPSRQVELSEEAMEHLDGLRRQVVSEQVRRTGPRLELRPRLLADELYADMQVRRRP